MDPVASTAKAAGLLKESQASTKPRPRTTSGLITAPSALERRRSVAAGPGERGTHQSARRKLKDAAKDEVRERKVRSLAPAADPPPLFVHGDGDALPASGDLAAAAASRSRAWREHRRNERTWNLRPYANPSTMAVDDAVELPRGQRALRYALGGPQVPPDLEAAAAAAAAARPVSPSSPLRTWSRSSPYGSNSHAAASPLGASGASLASGTPALEKRPRSGSPAPLEKYLAHNFPPGTFGH